MALEDNLIEPARMIVEEVESLTGKPVEILEFLKLETPAATDPGFGEADQRHLIKIKAETSYLLQYYVVHECLHLLRLAATEPEKRKRIVVPHDEAIRGLEALFGKTGWEGLEPQIVENRKTVFTDIVIKLTSGVQDLWVEETVLERYAGTQITEEQVKVGGFWRSESEETIGQATANALGQRAFEVINAMNWAKYELIRNKVIEFPKAVLLEYKKHPTIVSKGQRLIRASRKAKPRDYGEDVELTDIWAEILGIGRCYCWVDF